jgi:serine/threonine protein kinase
MPLFPMLAAPHEILGNKFELLEPLGHGSFGDVWKARRLADDAIVALKIPRDWELGAEVLRREPELMQAFNHPNIVRVYGFHTLGSLFIIEMEYVAGYNLADVLDGVNRNNPLSYRRILLWTKQILEGLQTIHAANVVHGDIKPQNVLIGPNDEAKLVDFGTSRRLEDVWVWTRRQGTEAYWAPEVAFEEQRGLVSDIYSVGIMLYEMVVGELPYKSPFQLASGLVVKRPREVNPNAPTQLEAIILRAIARNPEDRYATCIDMLADINSLIDHIEAGTLALPPDRTQTARIPFRPDSSSPLYYLEEAKACLTADDLAGARRAAEIAVERSDGHPNYLRLLGSIYLRMDYPIKALETYERVLTAYDRDFPATDAQVRDVLERLGQLYIQTKHYRQAVSVYERLLIVTDNPVYTRFKLAMACGLDADYPRAIKLLEEVRQERPDAAIVYSKLGWAYMLEGNTRQALSYYNQALLIDAADLFSLFELGRYYWIIGDRSRARGYFDRVRQHDQRGEYTEKVKGVLGKE